MKKSQTAEQKHGKPCRRMKRQLRELAEAYVNLSEWVRCSERGIMETLLDIFEPEELVEMGYGERVKAYLLEYGADGDWEAVSRKVAGHETV